MIYKYNDFLIESQFSHIENSILFLIENGKWTSDNTYEWDIEPSNQDNFSNTFLKKLNDFLKKIPKDKIKYYFIRLMNKIKDIPYNTRKKMIIGITSVFLLFVGLNYLISDDNVKQEDIKLSRSQILEIKNILSTKNIKKTNKKSSFDEAQKLVKISEAGYSNDRGDNGNWIIIKKKVKNKIKSIKRFVGTNYGISAPILYEYLGKVPTKRDMINLSYETAKKIYKKKYWDEQNLSEFNNQSISNIIYDGCVNQGISAMKTILSKSIKELGINELENIFTKNTIEKINKLDQEKLFNLIKKYRILRYKESKTFKRHGEGWLNRVDSLEFNR